MPSGVVSCVFSSPMAARGVEHFRPVFDGGAQIVKAIRFAASVDFEMNERFEFGCAVARVLVALSDALDLARLRTAFRTPDAKHRMNRRMQREPEPVHFHGHGIDEERHVVVDDLDDRMIRVPAVLFEIRIVDAQHFMLAGELLRRLPVRHRDAVEIGDIAARDVFRIDLIVVMPQQRLDQSEGRLR